MISDPGRVPGRQGKKVTVRKSKTVKQSKAEIIAGLLNAAGRPLDRLGHRALVRLRQPSVLVQLPAVSQKPFDTLSTDFRHRRRLSCGAARRRSRPAPPAPRPPASCSTTPRPARCTPRGGWAPAWPRVADPGSFPASGGMHLKMWKLGSPRGHEVISPPQNESAAEVMPPSK